MIQFSWQLFSRAVVAVRDDSSSSVRVPQSQEYVPTWNGVSIILLAALTAVGCATEKKISFNSDVYPILEENCIDCHSHSKGKGYKKTGLNMETYEALMYGSLYGPVVIPRDPEHSVIIMLIEGRADESLRMPHDEDEPLSEQDIATLRLWVKQGAKNTGE